MAEAFALAASIFATIQIADRVITLCKSYIDGVKDAPADLRSILLEISTLKTILENVKFLSQCDGDQSAALKSLDDASGPVAECEKTMKELEGLFPTSQSGQGTKRKRSGQRKAQIVLTLESLAWPFKEPKARKLLSNISNCKNTIGLAITADTAHDVQYMRKKTDQIQANLNEAQRREVLNWLESTRPSELHHRAQRNYEPGTCDWIMRLPEWSQFLNNAERRCLWIHGIPGAGKTVLASQLIRKIEDHCKALGSAKFTNIYYYCYFGHSQDESTPFLKWILNQLCRKADNVSDHLWNLFKQGGSPCLDDLLSGISFALEHFSAVYVTIDAVDESQSRENILEVLQVIATEPRFIKLHLLITSREFQDIERVLSSVATPVSMKNEFLDADIRLYTQSRLSKEQRFRSWPEDLREDTVEALSDGAKGMFRWVVCQIDILRRIKYTTNAIREELKRLPKTLDEAYDRIFRQIPDEDLQIVDIAMKWMCYDVKVWRRESLALRILVEASNFDIATEMPQQNLFYDTEAFRDVCGCLITVTTKPLRDAKAESYLAASFAHYTVLEYLASRHRYRPDPFFSQGPKFLAREKAESIIRGALSITNNDIDECEKVTQGNHAHGDLVILPTFASDCACRLVSLLIGFEDDLSKDEEFVRLAFEALNHEKEHYSALQKAWEMKPQELSRISAVAFRATICWAFKPSTQVHVFAQLALLECPNLASEWLKTADPRIVFGTQLDFRHSFLATDINSRHGGNDWRFRGDIVECFAILSSEASSSFEMLQFLIDIGEDFFDSQRVLLSFITFHGWTHLLYCGNKYPCVLEKLLNIGAEADMTQSHVTPLQIAVASLDVAGTVTLLKAKADPNHKGCLAAESWPEDDLRSTWNCLSGLSPLQICRSERTLSRWGFRAPGLDASEEEVQAQSRIEKVLLDYGAKG